MNLVVLGATGGTGMELVRESLKRGHSVTGFVRNAARLSEFHGRIRVVEGDLSIVAHWQRFSRITMQCFPDSGRVFPFQNRTPTCWSSLPQCLPAQCRMQKCAAW